MLDHNTTTTPTDRADVVSPSPRAKGHPRRGDPQKSRIANGYVVEGDNRSPWARRLKELLAAHLEDIPEPSVAERSLIRRASVLELELERLESKFAAANEASVTDLDLYQRTSGNLRRLLESLGLQARRSEDEPLGLAGWLAKEARDQRRAQQQQHNDDLSKQQ